MGKAPASGFGQFAQAAKIFLGYSCCCLDLHSGNGSRASLNNKDADKLRINLLRQGIIEDSDLIRTRD